jgi:hypothetical protein
MSTARSTNLTFGAKSHHQPGDPGAGSADLATRLTNSKQSIKPNANAFGQSWSGGLGGLET